MNAPGASSTFPYAINNAGTVVGGDISSTDGFEHGFIYRADGSFQRLDNPAFQSTTLVGINNLGQIVGTTAVLNPGYEYPGPFLRVGFLYSGGSFVQLGYGNPTAINDSGAIAVNAPGFGGGGHCTRTARLQSQTFSILISMMAVSGTTSPPSTIKAQ